MTTIKLNNTKQRSSSNSRMTSSSSFSSASASLASYHHIFSPAWHKLFGVTHNSLFTESNHRIMATNITEKWRKKCRKLSFLRNWLDFNNTYLCHYKVFLPCFILFYLLFTIVNHCSVVELLSRVRRGSRKKHLGEPGPLNFPSPPLFPTPFPSRPPCPLNFPSHPSVPSPPFLPLSFFLSFPSLPSPPFLPLPSLPLEVGPLKSS